MQATAWNFGDLPWRQPIKGFHVKRIPGVAPGVFWSVVAPGVVEPDHTHAHDQLLIVLEGEVRITIDGEALSLTAGSVLRIPPGVRHAAEYLARTQAIGICSPVGALRDQPAGGAAQP